MPPYKHVICFIILTIFSTQIKTQNRENQEIKRLTKTQEKALLEFEDQIKQIERKNDDVCQDLKKYIEVFAINPTEQNIQKVKLLSHDVALVFGIRVLEIKNLKVPKILDKDYQKKLENFFETRISYHANNGHSFINLAKFIDSRDRQYLEESNRLSIIAEQELIHSILLFLEIKERHGIPLENMLEKRQIDLAKKENVVSQIYKTQNPQIKNKEDFPILTDFKDKDRSLELWKWTGSENRIWWEKDGVRIREEPGMLSTLDCRKTFSGDIKIKIKAKMKVRDFRVFIGDYWFIFNWELGGDHHFRNTRKESTKAIRITSPQLDSNTWYLFGFYIKNNICKVLINYSIVRLGFCNIKK